ncbi:btk-binding protein-related [Anaeramoeba flamelloides]|uniref:Btk-binding protein-related n=1 Tax=Anaeramoeba flamelloides TaxID=1746091 RepID=A0AAV7ZMI5_9EUKA|nr:btk-binding protein-related [Anaeramoeba flamelloides]
MSKQQKMFRVSCDTNNSTLTKVKVPEGVQFVNGGYGDKNVVLVGSKGECYRYDAQANSSTDLKLPKCAKAAVGYDHYLVLTREGMVYSSGSGGNGTLGHGSQQTSCTTPTLIKFFQEKNLKVVDIQCGVFQSFFLCENGELYGCGNNGSMQLGISDRSNKFVPTKITEQKVTRVWSGNYAYGHFHETEDKKLYGFGDGISGNKQEFTSKTIFQNKTLIDMACGYHKNVFLMEGEENNQVYFCESSSEPRLWSACTEKNIVAMSFTCHHTIFRGKDGKLWGSSNPPNGIGEIKNGLPEIKKSQYWQIVCGAWNSVIFPVSAMGTLYSDIDEHYKSKTLCDFDIYGIPVHKQFIEARLNNEAQEIKEILEGYSKEEIQNFMNWVYTGDIKDKKKLQIIAIRFGIKEPEKLSIKKMLKKMYVDEDSKDFAILVKDDEDEDDDEDISEEEEEEEEEPEFEEIPVHKLILQIRSGLFREMFQNIKEESKQVKDFSGLGIDAMEIFIKYLYTDKVELTADHDPETVLNAFSNVIEYFKLNEDSTFLVQVEELKKFYNLD